MQDQLAVTSNAEITRRTHTARDSNNFVKWDAAQQKAAIKACGIGVSKYAHNKTKRVRILKRLSCTELPTHPGAVLRKIKAMNLDPSGCSSRQQRAYLLLYHMTPLADRGEMDAPPTPLPVRTAVGPSKDLLATWARVLLWARVHKDLNRKAACYRKGKVKGLWMARRLVSINALDNVCFLK